MRYMKYVISNGKDQCEEVRAFRDKDFPSIKTYRINDLTISLVECQYKEKYKIWRRGLTPYHDLIGGLQ